MQLVNVKITPRNIPKLVRQGKLFIENSKPIGNADVIIFSIPEKYEAAVRADASDIDRILSLPQKTICITREAAA
jgi:hypothetical protein